MSRTLADIYRTSDPFTRLRDPDLLKGRCGRCEYRDICDGSRSRALALTGDPFEADPWCACEPAGEGNAAMPSRHEAAAG